MACSTTANRIYQPPLRVSYEDVAAAAAAAGSLIGADAEEGIMGQGSCKPSGGAAKRASSIAPSDQPKRTADGNKYRLLYFNVRGRAETTRMMFALAGVPYEDVRLTNEEWPALKNGTPFGQLPVLEVNGSYTLCQQFTIERYIAGELGLNGRNSQEAATIDMISECMRDSMALIVLAFNEPDQEKKVALLTEYATTTKASGLQNYMRFLDAQLRKPWFLGDQISLADVTVYNGLCNIKMLVPTAVPETGSIAEWLRRFEAHPRIDHWIKTRPVSPY